MAFQHILKDASANFVLPSCFGAWPAPFHPRISPAELTLPIDGNDAGDVLTHASLRSEPVGDMATHTTPETEQADIFRVWGGNFPPPPPPGTVFEGAHGDQFIAARPSGHPKPLLAVPSSPSPVARRVTRIPSGPSRPASPW